MKILGLSLAILAVARCQPWRRRGTNGSSASTTSIIPERSRHITVPDIQAPSHPATRPSSEMPMALTGTNGSARVYWELSGNATNSGRPVPTSTEQYTLEFFGTTEVGHNGFDPVESQFNGAAGETFPIDSDIPWAGEFGTNHQYVATDGTDDGQFHSLGPGPHTPDTASFNATGNGIYMWLTAGSWLYAKYDFGFPIDRSWSALRLTQVTGVVPEPASGVLMLLGGVLMIRQRRQRA